MLTQNVTDAAMAELPEVISGGIASFKMFTTFGEGSASGNLLSDDGVIWGVMNAAERAGGVVMVHAEDNCIINFNTRRLYAEGREAARNINTELERWGLDNHTPEEGIVRIGHLLAWAEALAGHFESLDDWMTGGGFKPRAWENP